MEWRVVTDEELGAAVTAVVEEAGHDYRYPVRDRDRGKCYYVWEGKPDCFAGRVLHFLGVSVEELAQHEETPVSEVVDDIAVDLTIGGANALEMAQGQSDQHRPWGMAAHTFRVAMGWAS